MEKDRMFQEIYNMIYDIKDSGKQSRKDTEVIMSTLDGFTKSMTRYMNELMEMQMRQNELLTVQALGVRRGITKDPAEMAIIDAQIMALTNKFMVAKKGKTEELPGDILDNDEELSSRFI